MPCDQDRTLKLPAREVGPSDVADLPGPHQVVEGGKRLFDGGRRIPSVGWIQVHVVDLEPPKTVFTCLDDPSPRKAFGVARLVHTPAAFGCQHDGVAYPAMPTEPAADDLLRRAARPHRWVHVGGVDEVAAGLDVVVEQSGGAVLIGLLAESHRTQGELRHQHTRAAQQALTHPSTWRGCDS